MKKLYASLLLFSLFVGTKGQTQSHVPAPPPVNPGYDCIRSLSVDCTGQVLYDMAYGSQNGEEADLIDYIRQNYIGYVILRDLENANVFGDPVLEPTLHQLIYDIHSIDPAIQVGLCGSSAATFKQPFVLDPALQSGPCAGFVQTVNLNFDISAPMSYPDEVRFAIISFLDNIPKFESNEYPGVRNICESNFDALYLDYPFWETTTSMTDMQHSFENYKDILRVMRSIRCHSPCIRFIDAEFLPTDMYMLQGWTAIDQITEADTLIDRVVIPAFTNDPSEVFNLRCKTMHFLSDRFSKTKSKLFVKLSAESQWFHYCNSLNIPNDYLGDYLNGFVFPSGNMYSVEQKFLDQFNDPGYVCPACNCVTFPDNHYSTTNIRGNFFTGIIWDPYTMLKENTLFRRREIGENQRQELPEEILFDLLGRRVFRDGFIKK